MKKLYKNNLPCLGPVSNTSTPQKQHEYQEPISKSSWATPGYQERLRHHSRVPIARPSHPTSKSRNVINHIPDIRHSRLHAVVTVALLGVVSRRLVLSVFHPVIDVVGLRARRTTPRRPAAGTGSGGPTLAGVAARMAPMTRRRSTLLLPFRRPPIVMTRRRHAPSWRRPTIHRRRRR